MGVHVRRPRKRKSYLPNMCGAHLRHLKWYSQLALCVSHMVFLIADEPVTGCRYLFSNSFPTYPSPWNIHATIACVFVFTDANSHNCQFMCLAPLLLYDWH